MASVRRRSGRVRVDLDADEVAVLIALTTDVLDLLSDEESVAVGEGSSLEDLLAAATVVVDAPSDPAVARLLPAAYRDDAEAAGEFRRLTDSDLRATKRAALSQVVADLSNASGAVALGDKRDEPHGVRLMLEDAEAVAWLPALTDVRLTLGTRMEVTEDMDAERAALAAGSSREAEFAVYDWLSWLQDAMVEAVSGR
jgi:Domain of unknown function (DUF2017)